MRFKLWIYLSSGHITACVEDTSLPFFRKGAVLLRDQSSYPGDNGKMVWKNASCPSSVMHAVKAGKGFVIAESDCIDFLDASIRYNLLKGLWSRHNDIQSVLP